MSNIADFPVYILCVSGSINQLGGAPSTASRSDLDGYGKNNHAINFIYLSSPDRGVAAVCIYGQLVVVNYPRVHGSLYRFVRKNGILCKATIHYALHGAIRRNDTFFFFFFPPFSLAVAFFYIRRSTAAVAAASDAAHPRQGKLSKERTDEDQLAGYGKVGTYIVACTAHYRTYRERNVLLCNDSCSFQLISPTMRLNPN